MPHGEATRGVARLLLEEGVNIEAGDKAVVRLLLEKGADVEAKNQRGRTALIVTGMRQWFNCCWRRGPIKRRMRKV
jgi:hypothetical protein